MAFIERVAYDETPLMLRVFFDVDVAAKQKSTCWVIETEWLMLLRKENHERELEAPNYFVLRGCLTPQVRATIKGTGESVRDVLKSCMQVPVELLHSFGTHVRICESDEAGANGRCEALVMRERAGIEHQSWGHFSSICLAHKLHNCATRTWALCKDTLSPIIHCCLHLRLAGSVQKLREAVPSLVQSELHVLHGVALSPCDQQFREKLLDFCLPPHTKPRKRAAVLVLASMLNGRWEEGSPLTHLCHHGCCSSQAESQMKVAWALDKALGALQPGVFSKNNWAEWASSLSLWLLGSVMHDFIGKLFRRAFSNTEVHQNADNDDVPWFAPPQEAVPDDADQDRFNQERLERAKTLKISLEFMSKPRFVDIHLLRVSLEPEKRLMSSLLHSVGQDAELEELHQNMETGRRDYRVLRWLRGEELNAFFTTSLSQLHDTLLWSEFPETEAMRSSLLKVCCAPAAIAWQLIVIRVQGCPYRVLGLLEEQGAEDLANSLRALPDCQLDSFTREFLLKYDSVEMMLSQEAKELLSAMACVLQTCTYNTERVHSKNLRRARKRVSVTIPDVKHIALSHMHAAGEQCFRPSVAAPNPQNPRKRGRPAKSGTGQPQAKKRRGGGGAWRAFQHSVGGSRRFTAEPVKELARAYRALTPDELALYADVGRAGCLSPNLPKEESATCSRFSCQKKR